ncbi:hypothetical protein LGH83_17745 [Lichenihabitans sp. PAMC28606]|uniref:hypothetical protein n=1 Tax=Lichenihabitans sp. PAMC28606 TaxID=2880932 RepID=UPI001D0B8DEE|nr:hypothetical protein [Lichenihabitans sp. PAMC28606]UDL94333.1 hypothetical protein LGH83_17745 [Lichenihabitans sp. PAMC28606]
MLTIVCMKWGQTFLAEHVNGLYRGVKRHLKEPFRFVCLTDDAAGLSAGIDARPIPDLGLPPERWTSGCWPKLSVFMPGLFDDASLVMYIDLDVVILGSLSIFVDRARAIPGLHILKEWNPMLWSILPAALRPDRGAQGSLFAWVPNQQHIIFNRFMADQEAAYAVGHTDQGFIGLAANNKHYWPSDWTVSFKRTCVWYYPLNLVFRRIRQPKRARVVIFHGSPRPWDLLGDAATRWGTSRKFGFGPVPWVQRYWAADAPE